MKEILHGFVVQAHPDDRAHTMGADAAYIAAGGRLSYVTFTDGAARKLPNFPDENVLREIRAYEDKRQVSFIGGQRLYSGGYPDAYLPLFNEPAKEFLANIIHKDAPDFLISPHREDPHEDHAEAAKIVLAVAGDIPVYFMDTATGINRKGDRIRHTHFIPLTRNEVRKGKMAFRLNRSQTYDLPEGELKNVFDVMGMPKRVATDLGIPEINYAAALTLVDFSLGDPLTQAFGNERIIVNKEMLIAGV